MEEATLFFTLSADAYLRKGGTIAFVMPEVYSPVPSSTSAFRNCFRATSSPR
jgi:hypothetical protein